MKRFKKISILFFIFILFFVFIFSGCGEGIKSEAELRSLFPKTLGESWELDDQPMVPPTVGDGYMHAFYNKAGHFCKIKVWIIDKKKPSSANLWLKKLMECNHTKQTILPFPATNLDLDNFYKGFKESESKLNENKVFEYIITGDSEYIYYVMYTVQGRYVIGMETLGCEIISVEEARYELWPLVEQLVN